MPPKKVGERRLQILQTLAEMLQHPKGERITTALLAARLEVSEAALYRHFASKAQMFEGLIEFIEGSVFGLINQIETEQEQGLAQLRAILAMLLGFAAKNPGMVRVLIGDALVNENERLQVRINQLHDRIEASLKQALRVAASQGHALGQFPEHEALEEILEGERCCSYCRHTYSAYFQMFQGEYSQAPTTTSHTRVTGMKIFQPRRMIWS